MRDIYELLAGQGPAICIKQFFFLQEKQKQDKITNLEL